MDNEHRRHWKFWFALAGVAAIIFIVGAILLPVLSGARSGIRKPTEQNYLKQLGLVFKMYSNEHDDMFPPMTPYHDYLMFDLQTVYPEYLSDLSILVSPNLPNEEELREQINTLSISKPIHWEALTQLAAQSFSYIGWAIHDVSEMEQLVIARRGLDSSSLHGDIEFNGKKFHRLKEGVEDHFISGTIDPNSSAQALSLIPVMIGTRPHPQHKDVRNVLYMDGHVESRKDFSAIPSVKK